MGWGTSFKTQIYLNKMTFGSYEELKSKISELEEDIKGYREKIYMYSTSNPNDIVPDDYKYDSVSFIHSNITELIETMEEDMYNLQLLRMFKEHLKENNLNIEDFNPFKK